jgi:tRNA threonylcarbamoyladenosine biosynthesis protein TsaB
MNILALETSGYSGDVALLVDDRVVAEVTLPEEKRTAQMLAPGIAAALAEIRWQPRDVDLVAVTTGPGSFTGLRVGVTTAKTYAYAAGAQVLGVDTLAVIAAQAPPPAQGAELWAVLDAQRQQLFAARFCSTGSGWEPCEAASILDREQFLARLRPGMLVTGTGLERLDHELPPGVLIVPRELWHPRAATVGELAWRDYQAGRRDDLWQLAPRYLRLSAAEEQQTKRTTA